MRLRLLEEKLKKIDEKQEQAFTVFWSDAEIQEHKMRLHKEIEEILAYRTQGAALRCKVNWAENGSRPSKYFLNLEKSKYNRKVITRLWDPSGAIVSTQEEVLELQEKFYTKLFRGNEINRKDIDQFFVGLQSPKLSERQKQDLELPVSLPELSAAVKSMNNCKTHGPDGFSVEFYKCFWGKLKYFFLSL